MNVLKIFLGEKFRRITYRNAASLKLIGVELFVLKMVFSWKFKYGINKCALKEKHFGTEEDQLTSLLIWPWIKTLVSFFTVAVVFKATLLTLYTNIKAKELFPMAENKPTKCYTS